MNYADDAKLYLKESGKVRVLPYKFGSRSAKALAQALGTKRVKHDGNFKNNYVHPIVNWGSSRLPEFPVYRWLNNPSAVGNAANKLIAFQRMERAGVPVPEFTTDGLEVLQSLSTERHVEWVARGTLTGHSGQGISLIYGGTEYGIEGEVFPDAPLYVKYIKKKDEYRVHVCNGEVIDVQKKMKRREVPNEEVDYQVRNHGNGWIFARLDCNPDRSVTDSAVAAVAALGLDFGAVDVVWNEHRQEAYVLEVNTACGLEGQTVESYANAIRRLVS